MTGTNANGTTGPTGPTGPTGVWSGAYTALVTPFKPDRQVDFVALGSLVRRQIDSGIDGLVMCGTTGEGVTLDPGELARVVGTALEVADGKVPVIAGAGGNDTRRVVRLAQEMERTGADGLLSVVPFYNKPTQAGILDHFWAVADAVKIPIMLYNVPGRTGANLLPETVLKLAEHTNVRGLKEASGNLDQTMDVVLGAPDGFSVLSGDDGLTLPALALGAKGVVSVVSNQVPGRMSQMVHHALEGRFEEARKIHYELWPLMQINFIETNPGPVKAALAAMGLIGEVCRPPLAEVDDASRRAIRECLDGLGLLAGSLTRAG